MNEVLRLTLKTRDYNKKSAIFIAIWVNSNWSNVKELVQLLLPAETALLGSAIDFYVGNQRKD